MGRAAPRVGGPRRVATTGSCAERKACVSPPSRPSPSVRHAIPRALPARAARAANRRVARTGAKTAGVVRAAPPVTRASRVWCRPASRDPSACARGRSARCASRSPIGARRDSSVVGSRRARAVSRTSSRPSHAPRAGPSRAEPGRVARRVSVATSWARAPRATSTPCARSERRASPPTRTKTGGDSACATVASEQLAAPEPRRVKRA